MKGFLHKTEQGWVVKHSRLNDDGEPIGFDNYEELPLHPDDVKEIEEWLFDNTGVIYHSQEVEFEIVSDTYEKPGKGNTYAKLIPSKERLKKIF